METLKIQIPNGFEVDSFDRETSELKLKPKKPQNAMERIKTFDDVLADNGIPQQQFDKQSFGEQPDEVAYRMIKLLAKSLNEGWTPDWNNSNEYKYVPWFYLGGSSGFRCDDFDYWHTVSDVGSRLCFKSAELAKYAGTQFTEIYKQFML